MSKKSDNESSTYVISNQNTKDALYDDLIDGIINGKQTYTYSNNACYETLSEKRVNDWLLTRDVEVNINGGSATISVYEYVKIKYLVENDDKKLLDLTRDELDVYITTVRL